MKKFIIIGLLLLATSAQAETFSFGDSAAGVNAMEIRDVPLMYKIQASATGTLNFLRADVLAWNAATYMKAAIYNSSKALIASTQQVQVPANGSNQWVDFNFSSPPSVTSGDYYWLGIWAENVTSYGRVYWDAWENDSTCGDSTVYGTWPDPFVPTHCAAGLAGRKLQILAYGTVTGAPTINPPTGCIIDSLKNDFSAENDSLDFVFTTPATAGYDYVVVAWSTSAFPDSTGGSGGLDSMTIPYVASTKDSMMTVFGGTEQYTLYASFWIKDGAYWSDRQTDEITFHLAPPPATGAKVLIRK